MTILGGIILFTMCAVIGFSVGWALGWYTSEDNDD